MNDPNLAPGAEHDEGAAAAWPRTAVLFTALVFCALAISGLASRGAEAQAQSFPVIDTANTLLFDCGPIGVRHEDPFADELGVSDVHQHFFRENRAIETYGEDITEEQLKSSSDTTCGPSWATGLQWNPLTRDPVNGVHSQFTNATIYVREGMAAPSQLVHIPAGAKMLAKTHRMTFNCTPGDQSGVTTTPPYGCKSDVVRIRQKFPQCWTGPGILPQNFTYPTNGRCPSGALWIPEISYNIGIRTPKPLASPLEISAGAASWKDWTFMHMDLWATFRQNDPTPDGTIRPPEGFREAVEACVMKPLDAPRYSYCTHPDSNDL